MNAPPGALIYYYLGEKPKGDVTLDVTDRSGKMVRHYTSAPPARPTEGFQPIPDFWKETPKPLPTETGTNRMNWDLRYDDPPAFSRGYDISATPFLTPMSPQGPLVLPGVYTVTLTVDGKKYVQKVAVKNDPRSPATARDLRAQHELQMDLYDADRESMADFKAVNDLHDKVSALQKTKLPKDVSDAVDALNEKLDQLGGSARRGPLYFFGASAASNFGAVQGETIAYLAKMEFGDFAPSQPVRTAVADVMRSLALLRKEWKTIQEKDLKSVNAKLTNAALPELH